MTAPFPRGSLMRQSPATCDRAANGHYQQRTALVVTPELSKKKKNSLQRWSHVCCKKKKKRNQIVSHRNSRKREWKSAILACHIFSRSPGLQVSGPRRVHLISHCNCTARQRWHSLEGSEKKRRERHIQGYTVNTVAEFCKY